MSDDEFEQDDTQEDEERGNLKVLRQKAKAHDTAVAEAAAARRELAFYQAGIPDTPLGKLFTKGYEGDATPEAIKAGAVEVGILDPSVLATIPVGESAALNRTAEASAGAGTATPSAEWEADMAAARTPEEVYDVQVKHRGWSPRDGSRA